MMGFGGATMSKPIIDLDARKAMQVRWSYWAGKLGEAVVAEDQAKERRAMAILVAIETEAMKNGWIEDLETGDTDPATGQMVKNIPVLTAKAAVGHRAEIMGGLTVLLPLVGHRYTGHRMTGDSELGRWPRLDITGHSYEVDEIETKSQGKVKVDIMALGVKNVVGGVPVGAQFETPVSQVGKTAGQPLSKAQVPAVSKAEQLKAMKKVQASTTGSKGVGDGVATAKPKSAKSKPKVQTLCLDGCGQTCGGRFATGHDAKLKSLLTKIEDGRMDVSELPEIVRPFVKFGKPVKVAGEKEGEFVMTYPILMAPVRFPGRDDIEYVQDLGEAFGHK